MSGGLRLDLHLHSTYSRDSRLPLEATIAELGRLGLDGFALTDHNNINGHAALRALADKFPQYRFIPGVEVSTREGHLLALGVHELPPLHAPVVETVEWVEAHGGVAVPAHPARHSHGIGRRIAEHLKVPALETLNGHNSERANLRAAAIALHRQLGETGGSDAHDVASIGRGYTTFPPGLSSIDQILEEVHRRHTRSAGVSLHVGEMARLAARTVYLRAMRGFRSM